MRELWPWLALGGLGMYYGINPPMGWLFGVALGLHRGCGSVVVQSLIPIAIGHLLSIAVVADLDIGPRHRPRVADAGGRMILWALYHFAHGSRHQARIGMRAGFAGFLGWSFLMASAQGGGLMVVPTLVPLCLSGSGIDAADATGPVIYSLAAVCVHTAAMVAVSGLMPSLFTSGSASDFSGADGSIWIGCGQERSALLG